MARDLPSQHFAWDLLALGEDGLRVLNGKLSDQPGTSDFACFGQPVLSPGGGVVVGVVDHQPDATLVGSAAAAGGRDPRGAAGNRVVIDHGDGVFSCVAHLRADSVRVNGGSAVRPGDVLGAVGSPVSGQIVGP